jgi:2'-5' RNA ligase
MRCFVAINLGDSLKKEIGAVVAGLNSGNWDVRWVPAENLHITIKFLGEISEDLAEKVKGKLSEVSGHHRSFEMNFFGVGVFPDRKRPRVVWIDLRYPTELDKLQEEVEDALSTIGLERENRKFSPHLTIGRVRSLKGTESLLSALEGLRDRDFGNIEVGRISLMKSDLKPAGAQYSVMTEFPLTRRNNDQ